MRRGFYRRDILRVIRVGDIEYLDAVPAAVALGEHFSGHEGIFVEFTAVFESRGVVSGRGDTEGSSERVLFVFGLNDRDAVREAVDREERYLCGFSRVGNVEYPDISVHPVADQREILMKPD